MIIINVSPETRAWDSDDPLGVSNYLYIITKAKQSMSSRDGKIVDEM